MGDKVRLTLDKQVVKYFYRKRWLSSALIYPYAQRFCCNADKLRQRGITSPRCTNYYYDAREKRDIVVYPYLPGTPLRALLSEPGDRAQLLENMARFFASLHYKGIYFRSVHFGNVLVRDKQAFALIDVTDVNVWLDPLGPMRRARNFRHLLHDPQDQQGLNEFGFNRFLLCYESTAELPLRYQKRFRFWLRRYAPDFLRPN